MDNHCRSQAAWAHVYRRWPILFCGGWFAGVDYTLAVGRSQCRDRIAAGFQPAANAAWHSNGVPGRDADSHRLFQLPGATDDRGARSGIPPAQLFWLLVMVLRGPLTIFQLYRRRWVARHGQCASGRMVRICTANGNTLLAWQFD